MEEIISEQFEKMYETEGYRLVASTNVRIPWFQCTLKCKCMTDQPMSELEGIICKCINRRINIIKDISFVLALDAEIVSGAVDELVKEGILSSENGIFLLTKSGEESYGKHSRKEILTQEFNVYMNGITGEWIVEINALESELSSTDVSIQLQPIRSVIKLNIENDDDIKSALQKQNNTNIVSMALLDYKVVIYTEERIFFYKNEIRKILFSIYNSVTKEINIKLGDALLQKYKKRELLEIMQAQKYILNNEALVDQYRGKVNELKYYRNKQIRELFKNVFEIAETSILIISPWIDNNNYVMTKELLDKIERALSQRKIKISIGYGYGSTEQMEKKRWEYNHNRDEKKIAEDRNWQTELMANKLKERFGKYKNFSIFHVGTHEKILSYDDRYTLIGSYNLLSYDGGESRGYAGYSFRFEGGVMIDDVDFAKYIKDEIMM